MVIKSLDNLEIKFSNENLFDLTQASFKPYGSPFVFHRYIVPREFEMRMDLICNDLYKSTEYVDFLLSFNNIINPLNIIEGAQIFYVDIDIIPSFYAPKENQEEVQSVFLNNSKKKRKDNKRDKFVEEKRAGLPPTLNEVKSEQVKVEGNTVIIGGDIFNI